MEQIKLVDSWAGRAQGTKEDRLWGAGWGITPTGEYIYLSTWHREEHFHWQGEIRRWHRKDLGLVEAVELEDEVKLHFGRMIGTRIANNYTKVDFGLQPNGQILYRPDSEEAWRIALAGYEPFGRSRDRLLNRPIRVIPSGQTAMTAGLAFLDQIQKGEGTNALLLIIPEWRALSKALETTAATTPAMKFEATALRQKIKAEIERLLD